MIVVMWRLDARLRQLFHLEHIRLPGIARRCTAARQYVDYKERTIHTNTAEGAFPPCVN